MAIKRKPKSKPLDEMPIAHLYLDEVREIVNVLTTADSDSTDVSFTVKYRVGEYECDNIEELEKIGGDTRKFGVTVKNGYRVSSLEISRIQTSLRLSCPENDFWIKHGRIRRIFDNNSVWWKNIPVDAFNRIPFWLVALAFFASLVARYFDPSKGPQHLYTSRDWELMVLTAGVFLSPFIFFGGSVVRLQYSHTGGIRRWIAKHGTQVVLIVVSAILGAIAKEAISHWWH